MHVSFRFTVVVAFKIMFSFLRNHEIKNIQRWLFAKSCKKKDPEIFGNFIRKHTCWILFINEVAGRPATFLKKRLRRWGPVNFAKFLRATFLQNTSGRLLPDINSKL